MEEPELIPEEIKKGDSSSENSNDPINQEKKIDKSYKNLEENKISNLNESTEIKPEYKSDKKDSSLFNRFLKEGFDGITTNPNYKLLALLIILLINLSLFLLVGNLGKSFLQNSGLLS